MGAMENMLASMLQKAIPPDVLAMLTPEKIEEYKNGVKALWAEHKEQVDRIEQKLDCILLEASKNDTGKRNSISKRSSD